MQVTHIIVVVVVLLLNVSIYSSEDRVARGPTHSSETGSCSNTTNPNCSTTTLNTEDTSPNATSPNATSPNATSPNATSPNATSPNATSPNATSPNATSPNATSPNATSPNATTFAPCPGDKNTNCSNNNTSTTEPPTTTTFAPRPDCGHFVGSSDKESYLPSDVAEVVCGCFDAKNQAFCPTWIILGEQKQAHISPHVGVNDTNDCSTNLTIYLKMISDQRRDQVEVMCLGPIGRELPVMITFEKADINSACNSDADCYSNEVLCLDGKCKCPNKETYFAEMNKCIRGQYLGESCMYQEECHAMVNNSACISMMCQCQDGYKPSHQTTCTSEGGGSSANWQTPSPVWNLAATVMAAIFIFGRSRL